MRAIPVLALTVLTSLALTRLSTAQPLGTFNWQLQPFCNRVTVLVTQTGSQFTVDGFDDQCGAGQRAPLVGLATQNPDGTIGFGLHIVTAPGGLGVTVAARISVATLGGTWLDSAGNSGTFVFNGTAAGSPRPAPTNIVNVVGTGTATTAARSDHTHASIGSSNTAVGDSALRANTTGSSNTAAGAGALVANTTGDQNTASGTVALTSNTTGDDNTATGVLALAFNTTGNLNTATGSSALLFNTTGDDNTATGGFALASNTTGDRNTATGFGALLSNRTGNDNTAAGQRALDANATGSANTATGQSSLGANTTGDLNTASGASALLGNTTGSSNTAVGARALLSNTIAGNNTAVGVDALNANTTGTNNLATGRSALEGNTTGDDNTAVGTSALLANTTGQGNTASGRGALFVNTTGSFNTASGANALPKNTTGDNNTTSGVGSLLNNTSGADNTAIGVSALPNNTTGSNNIAIGASAGTVLTTGSNNVYVQASAAAATEVDTMRLGSQITRTFIDGISGATSSSGIPVLVNATGQLGTTTSSARFKDDIVPIAAERSQRVHGLRPVRFVYKPEFDDGSRLVQYGLIAEDVAETFPELLVRDAEGRPQTVRYHLLPPLLLAEVQRLERERLAASERAAAQHARIATLERLVEALAAGAVSRE